MTESDYVFNDNKVLKSATERKNLKKVRVLQGEISHGVTYQGLRQTP